MCRFRLLVSLVVLSVFAYALGPANAQVGYLTGSPARGAAKGQQFSQVQGRGHCGMMMNSMMSGGMSPMGAGGFAGSFANGSGTSSFATPFANGNLQTPNNQEMMLMQQRMLYQMMLMQQYYMMQMMQSSAGLTQSPYQTALLGRQTPASNQTTQTTAYRQAASLRR